jgi:X-linked retinitis pigmentosa GTPase regulator
MESNKEGEGYTEVFAWGADRYGQLGLANKKGGRCYSIPKFCTFNVIIRRIACGEEHSAFITNNGSIYTMGSNTDGRLGIGDRSLALASTPCLIEDLASFRATEIACGWGHTAAVMDNGKVFTWGVGDYGALGISECLTQWRPVQVNLKEHIQNVSCGTRHTAFVDSKGKLFMCGAGDAGQLGLGSHDKKSLPTQVTNIKEAVISAACGIFHTLVLTSTKNVIAMGGNKFGQLGIGSKRSSLYPVAVKGLESERVVSIAAGHISAAVTEKGVVYVWGTGVFGECLIPTLLKGIKKPIKKVTVGGNFGAAIDYNGTLYTWGSNASGELGMGDYEPRAQGCQVTSMQGKCVEDVSCGGSYAIALGRTIPHKYVPPARSAARGNMQQRGKIELERELEMALIQSKISSNVEYKQGHRAESFIESNSKYKADTQSRYENNNRTRTEETKRIASPPRIESQYDEMLETYKAEQERCRNLRRRVTELQRSIQESESRVREATFRENDKRYLNRLSSVEMQLVAEKDKCGRLMKELEAEKRREEMISPEGGNLEARAGDLEITIAKLRQENSQMQQEKNPSDNLKVSALLKEYEDRIEQEIEDRRRITKEKGTEIRSLQDEMEVNENIITKLQSEKTMLANSYMEEVERLEVHVNEQKRLLDTKMLEKEDLLELKKQDFTSIDLAEDRIKRVNNEILDVEVQLKNALDELEYTKQQLVKIGEDIERSNEDNAKCRSLIEQRELEYVDIMTTGRDNDAKNLEEMQKLQEILEEKNIFNKELQENLIARVAEIESLSKDVNAWMEVANRSRIENTDLKKIIEGLESKNKKLMESMNLHMYNRAAEYKQRTINVLKASQLPNRIDKLRSSGYALRHVTPSPERFEKFMEEEKKSTSKGVDNVVNLTRFRAETVESIKNKRQGLRKDMKTPDHAKIFDAKFVVDQVDYNIEEDPQFVKSNYVLVKMLDQYNQPAGQQKLLEERKEVYGVLESDNQIGQSNQGFSLTSAEHISEAFASPDIEKLKGTVFFHLECRNQA